MSFHPKTLAATSFADQVADQIRTAILRGQLKPGDRLPNEEELARNFGISRATVREALKRLAAASLVRSVRGPRGGTFVARPDRTNLVRQLEETINLLVQFDRLTLKEITEGRVVIEAACCRFAAQRREEHELAALAEILRHYDGRPLDDDEFLAVDIAFHEWICWAAHNIALELPLRAIHLVVQPRANALIVNLLDKQRIIEQHRVIAGAIVDQDSDRAEAALRAHVSYLEELYDQVLPLPEAAPAA
jgi:GntR family transcriptional regulator, transcriptional repressor for pyruvate dehydrogenase complex